MGNLDCKRCSCTDKEQEQTEISFQQSKKLIPEVNNLYKIQQKNYNIRNVLKIQALWRGYQERKQLAFLQKKQLKYFTEQEIKEIDHLCSEFQTVNSQQLSFTFKSGAVYKGQWKNGKREGFGEQIWSDGAKYQGKWKENYAFGNGKFTHPDGEIYDGQWDYSKKSNDQTQNGYTWLQNKSLLQTPFSQSQVPLSPRSNISTQFSERKKSATAEREFRQHKYENGNLYMGEWLNWYRDGNGKMIWSNGDTFEGEWKNDVQDGYGVNRWVDGSTYEGYYKEGKKHGKGIYKWEDKSMFDGEWQNNLMDGFGKYVWGDGKSFEGNWKQGKMHGKGTFSWPDGRQYEGDWYEGKRHGEGWTVKPDGTKTLDQWKQGKIVRKIQ